MKLCPWSTCAIDYLGATARMDHACDDIGVGTIEMGNTVAVSMEGVLSANVHEKGDRRD